MRRLNKKGVSPVIATVLLIGMVIVLGLIVFTWMRALAQETVTKNDGVNVELVCNDVSFEAGVSSGTLLSISNVGTVPIFGFDVALTSPGTVSRQELSILNQTAWPKYGLNTGDGFSEYIPEIAGTSSITLYPILIGTSDDGGKKSFTCEAVGYKIEMVV